MNANALKQAGFSDAEITEYTNLQTAGFTEQEIDDYYSGKLETSPAPETAEKADTPNAAIAGMTPEELNDLPLIGAGKATGISKPPAQWKQNVQMAANEYAPDIGLALGTAAATPAAIAAKNPALIPLGGGLGKAAGRQGASLLASLIGFKEDKSLGDAAKQAFGDTLSGATETAAGMVIPAVAAKLPNIRQAMKFPLAEGETSKVGPIALIKEQLKPVVRGAVGEKPEWLIKKAYKPSTTLTPVEEDQIVKTILKNKIAPTSEGWNKLQERIGGLSTDVDDIIAASTSQGGVVDKRKALDYINGLKEKYSGYDTPDFLNALNAYEEKVMTMNPGKPFLTVQEAHDMKKGIWAQLEGYFGENTQQPVVEGMKRFGSGLREGVEEATKDINLPGYKSLKEANSELADLIDARDTVGRATGRIGNRNPVGLPAEIALNMATRGGPGAPVGAGVAIINNPTVKTKTAFALDSARKWAAPVEEEALPIDISNIGNPAENYLYDLIMGKYAR